MKTEKLYLASTGEEIKHGSIIKGSSHKDGVTSTMVITISDSMIPLLKDAGIVVTSPPEATNPTISKAIERIAEKVGWKPQKIEGYLSVINDIMPIAVFNIILKEIAIILDQKYPDHINKSEKIYCVSPLDGRIHEVCKGHIKNYRNFAAFRTIEDAKLACNILREPLKEMFKSGK